MQNSNKSHCAINKNTSKDRIKQTKYNKIILMGYHYYLCHHHKLDAQMCSCYPSRQLTRFLRHSPTRTSSSHRQQCVWSELLPPAEASSTSIQTHPNSRHERLLFPAQLLLITYLHNKLWIFVLYFTPVQTSKKEANYIILALNTHTSGFPDCKHGECLVPHL